MKRLLLLAILFAVSCKPTAIYFESSKPADINRHYVPVVITTYPPQYDYFPLTNTYWSAGANILNIMDTKPVADTSKTVNK